MSETPVLLESWIFDGIKGSSAIFLTEHVGSLDDESIKTLLGETFGLELGDNVTVKRDGSHVYVNYGSKA